MLAGVGPAQLDSLYLLAASRAADDVGDAQSGSVGALSGFRIRRRQHEVQEVDPALKLIQIRAVFRITFHMDREIKEGKYLSFSSPGFET